MATLNEMDEAAETAGVQLDAILNDGGAATDIVAWWAKWFQKAGHKRLGRLLVQAEKSLEKPDAPE